MMSDEIEKLVYTNKLLAEACKSHRNRIADLKEILMTAAVLVLTRRNNVSTEAGVFATVEAHSLLMLDTMLAEYFDLDSAEVTFENIDDLMSKIRGL